MLQYVLTLKTLWWAREVDQWVHIIVIATKPDNLILIPKPHMVGGEYQLPKNIVAHANKQI